MAGWQCGTRRCCRSQNPAGLLVSGLLSSTLSVTPTVACQVNADALICLNREVQHIPRHPSVRAHSFASACRVPQRPGVQRLLRSLSLRVCRPVDAHPVSACSLHPGVHLPTRTGKEPLTSLRLLRAQLHCGIHGSLPAPRR